VSAAVLTTAAVGGKAFWYLTRASGVVALVLLSATLVLGVVSSVGWTTERWPRFLSQDVHRNVSLLGLVFIGVHVATTVLDGYVPIGLVDVFVPFVSPYRPIYVGLGALAIDLLLAVLVTSGLRHRIGYASWRFVHWLAYLCWPIALVHALGSGTDTQLPVVLFVEAVCTAAVLGAFAWRMTTGRSLPAGRRTAAASAAVVVTVVIAGFALVGPLRPGWSHRSGTSPSLLAQLAAKNGAAATGTLPPASGTPSTTTPATGGGSVPAVPFTSQVSGSQSQSGPDAQGNVRITLAMHLADATSTPLTVVLVGAQAGGGVSLSSGTVDFGGDQGTVVGLNGGTIVATVATPSPISLTIRLQIGQQTGALTGSVTGTAGSGR
jgi:DMSO/TMAO reductase YedYZ heme-binding membrane subunit